MPACKREDNEEAAPEVDAPVPHVKEEPLPNDSLFTCLKGMRGWQWRERHGARYRRQLCGAVMVQGHHRVQVAVQTRRDPDLVRRVNAHIRSVLPQLTYTALAVVHGVGDHPMLVHTHPRDDSPLTGETALGDFVRGELFTSTLLCANGPSRPAWIRLGRDLSWGTLWILDMGSCLTLLGPTCLWRGLDSALCSYRTQALHGDICLWRCRMNWSRLASQGEDVSFV